MRTSEGITNNIHLRHQDWKDVSSLGGAIDKYEANEDRNIITNLLGKVKTSVNRLRYRKLTKYENLYRKNTTPEDLAKKYGTTKAQFQEEYRQFFKWRESWKIQRPYPFPNKRKIYD
ncbi:hypothetical protein PHMEG_0003386 [Phytophthora megakarya]|uniref:Uncharacterized protein n=1 Tax=Phytophthora megakarya TaxID=4795 RepID=A0A225WYA1_9STRA|nr:hypothetical protein PHMEG_0003386 [Phytophthora megakarya]